jgi:hypothetical protein
MILCDTLYLEYLEAKLGPDPIKDPATGKLKRSSLVLGENLSLKQIKTNCMLDFNSKLPNLETLIYTGHYNYEEVEGRQILMYCPKLTKLECQQNTGPDIRDDGTDLILKGLNWCDSDCLD